MKLRLKFALLLSLPFMAHCGFAWIPVTSSSQAPSSPSTPTSVGIYRSVGPTNTNILACGTTGGGCIGQGNLTLSGTGAVFASAVANNIGVGDAVVYDCSNNGVLGAGDCVGFIASRTNSTNYLVGNVTGGVPTAYSGSVWRIYRAYTSLASAVDSAAGGTENASITAINAALGNFDNWVGGTNLTVIGKPWNVALYNDATDNPAGQITISGWTTNASNYLRIYTPYSTSEVGTSQRHQGTWASGGYAIHGAAGTANTIAIQNNYVYLEGLRADSASTAFSMNILFATTPCNGVRMYNNIIRYTSGVVNSQSGVRLDPFAGETVYFYNNIIYTGAAAYLFAALYADVDPGTIYLYSNTMAGGGAIYSIYHNLNANPVILKNNLGEGYSFNNWDPSTDYNVATSASNTGVGAHDYFNAVVTFVNAGASDYRISVGDTGAKGLGTNLSADPALSFSVDVELSPRTVPWDIGASIPY